MLFDILNGEKMAAEQFSYKQFLTFLPPIVRDVKKEIKTELMRANPALFQKIFGKTFVAKLSTGEIVDLLKAEMDGGNSFLEGWISDAWIKKEPDIYTFFAKRLSLINPKFEEIREIDDEKGKELIEEAVAKFGVVKVCLFTILNRVAVSSLVLEGLVQRALHDR